MTESTSKEKDKEKPASKLEEAPTQQGAAATSTPVMEHTVAAVQDDRNTVKNVSVAVSTLIFYITTC